MNTKIIAGTLVALVLAFGGYSWYGNEDIYPGAPGDTWCNNDYVKRIDINVNNAAGSALMDYQVYVNLSSNPINETSLRVYNKTNCILRPHWCENITSGNCTKLWINYSSIAASSWTNNTAIYYENAGAGSASNGTNTFELFDDFTDNSTIATADQTTKDTVYDTTRYALASDVIKLHDDTLFAVFCEGDAHGSQNNHDVKWINSTDNGSTWSSPQTVATHVGTTDARNPSVLEFNNSGTWTILVYYDKQTSSVGDIYCKKSTDGGQTWGSEITVTTNNDRYTYGSGAEMSNGDLIFGSYSWNSGVASYAQVSTDAGGNWTEYTISSVSGMSETSIIEKNTNGHVLAMIRKYPTGEIWSSVSTDYGHTWSAAALTNITGADAPATITRLTNGNLIASWEKTNSDFRVARSDDEGATWDVDNSYSVYYDGSMPADAGYVSSVQINTTHIYSMFYIQHASNHADLYGNDVDISLDVWTKTGTPTLDYSNGILRIHGPDNSDHRLTSTKTFSAPHIMESRSNINWTGLNNAQMGFGLFNYSVSLPGYVGSFACFKDRSSVDAFSHFVNTNGSGTAQYSDGTAMGTYFNNEIKWKSDEIKYVYSGGTITHTTYIPTASLPIVIGGSAYASGAFDMYLDWLFVRKYAATEPSTTLGSEEQYSATTPVISNVTNGSISPTSQWIDWDVNQTAHNRVVYDKGLVNASSTACEGQWSSNHVCANASDGDWSSYAESASAFPAYAYFNYTVPTGASQLESLYHVKDSPGHANLTIPSACWGGTLYLRAMCSDIGNSITWQCDDGPGWTTLRTSVANVAYEQEMKFKYVSTWDNSTAAPNITLSSLTASTLYEFQAWSYNTTNTSLSDNSSTLNFTTASRIPIITKQWISVHSYNNTHVLYNITTWAYNNYTSAINISVDVDNNWTDYNINNLAVSSDDTHTQTATFVRPLSDANFTCAAAILGDEAFGTSNTIKTFLPVDPPSKAAGANDITILAGNRALFCNWSENQTFQQIQANLTNTTDYFWYNSASQKWIFYNVNRSINQDTIIDKHNAVMVCFNETTTVSCNILSPETITIPSNTWYYTGLRESTSKTLTEINTAITADGCTITDLYTWNSTAGAYTNTGSYSVLPNEGFAIYCSVGCNWDGSA